MQESRVLSEARHMETCSYSRKWCAGANDVANSFGSSVGAKAITIGQAVLIAGVCEFVGAVLLGASVTDTIKSNIAKGAYFNGTPEILMFGM